MRGCRLEKGERIPRNSIYKTRTQITVLEDFVVVVQCTGCFFPVSHKNIILYQQLEHAGECTRKAAHLHIGDKFVSRSFYSHCVVA